MTCDQYTTSFWGRLSLCIRLVMYLVLPLSHLHLLICHVSVQFCISHKPPEGHRTTVTHWLNVNWWPKDENLHSWKQAKIQSLQPGIFLIFFFKGKSPEWRSDIPVIIKTSVFSTCAPPSVEVPRGEIVGRPWQWLSTWICHFHVAFLMAVFVQ